MPTATTQGQPYTMLPASALDHAVQRRQQGRTNPQILAELTRLGYDTAGYDPVLLNHHVRREMSRRGIPVPTRRTTAPRTRAAAAWGTGRRFGIELEVVGLDPYEAARALLGAGIDAREEGYNHGVRTWWKVTTDGSLSGRSCEVVSPPMTDVTSVAAVCTALRSAGGRVDVSTGFHAHHEATDLSSEALAQVVLVMSACAADMDALVAQSRRASNRSAGWCRRMDSYEASTFAARCRQVRGTSRTERMSSASALGLGGRPDTRYRNLNVHSFGSYGTLEFRQHQGTLNARKVADWVLFGQAVLDWCKANPTAAAPVGTLVATLVADGLLDSRVADRMVRRFQAAA